MLLLSQDFTHTIVHLQNIGTQNYLMAVNNQDFRQVELLACQEKHPPCSLEFLLAAKHVMHQHNLSMPSNAKEALQLYIELVERLEHYQQHSQ